MERYLDLDLLVNGSMDALLLILAARLANLPFRGKRIAAGVIAGEIPVILSAYAPASLIFELSKYLIPWLMVWLAYPYRGFRLYFKSLLIFWILSAGLGGLIYALWGWFSFDGRIGGSLRLGLKNLWMLPLVAGLWWFTQKAWHRILGSAAHHQASIYDLEIDMGRGNPFRVKALLDTGNQLRDPLTGYPVILIEEEAAAAGVPEELLPVLQGAWRDLDDPWPWLWQSDSLWIKQCAFIPYQGVGHKSWLLGIRPQKVVCTSLSESREMKATLAFVRQVLSPDRAYQALLHPEHVQGAEES
ncbi:sigma-E processing peptidase SpoIIGA [Desulfitobacterium hafniense]|uniref:sigma-E processing peptidase SpoIIGA n=1 Tax=Desulfitobacterium hafniense TaxID=49338 RepID=UPI000361B219|nr:sigma-E processing peptidase SpoIIGA [Desulfitobacterium hafniense]